jgi:hypothetical protein
MLETLPISSAPGSQVTGNQERQEIDQPLTTKSTHLVNQAPLGCRLQTSRERQAALRDEPDLQSALLLGTLFRVVSSGR